MTPEQQQIIREVNQVMTYANQLDPLVPANEASLEVWTQALHNVNPDAAKSVIRQYYATIEPDKREPITPGYVKRKAVQLMARHMGDKAYCQEHNWNYRNQCTECRSEVAEGIRRPDQIGHQIKQPVPAPKEIMQQVKRLAALKGIDAAPPASEQTHN